MPCKIILGIYILISGGIVNLRNLALVGALSAIFSGSVFAGNIVINGGFEDCTISGEGDCMSMTGWAGGGAGAWSYNVHSGVLAAQFGAVGALDWISQALPTTPGQTYNLDYWFRSDAGTPNEFIVKWDGTALFDQTDIPDNGWQLYHFSVLATGASTLLEFDGRNDPTWLSLDDVSVDAAAPEPGTLALLGFGCLGLATWKRRHTA
jgi:hypothetical protein